jgi:hypothetical protein
MRRYRQLYRIKDVEDETRHGKTKIYELVGAGILDARKAGKITLITGESVERYVESLPKADIRTGQKADNGNADHADESASLSKALNPSRTT